MEKSLTLDWGTDELHEECGVFGMYDLTEMMLHQPFITDCSPYSTADRRAAESR
mgnify:CR=1 FL=1